MKINKYISTILAVTFLCSSLLTGCRRDTNEVVTTAEETIAPKTTEITAEPVETVPAAPMSTEDFSTTAVQTKTITISVFNMSDVYIGMFSVIDPVTNEQINLDSLESGTSVSLECNWPEDITEFHWALYNEAGELCIDASTDISAVNKAVALMLSGEGTIDNVEVISE